MKLSHKEIWRAIWLGLYIGSSIVVVYVMLTCGSTLVSLAMNFCLVFGYAARRFDELL